jgi:hypothetical protein
VWEEDERLRALSSPFYEAFRQDKMNFLIFGQGGAAPPHPVLFYPFRFVLSASSPFLSALLKKSFLCHPFALTFPGDFGTNTSLQGLLKISADVGGNLQESGHERERALMEVEPEITTHVFPTF